MLKIIVLDKDGTLLDTSPATLQSHIQNMEGYVDKERVIEVINSTLGHSADEQYAIMLGKPMDDPVIVERVKALWELFKKIKPRAFEDAMEIVPKLAEDGYTLVLSTGYKPDITKAQLDMVGLGQYFDLILGYTPPFIKGEAHMKKIMERYGLTLEEMGEVSIVGDGVGDMEMGRGYTKKLYGIDRVGDSEDLFATGALKVFPNLVEFYKYLKSIGTE